MRPSEVHATKYLLFLYDRGLNADPKIVDVDDNDLRTTLVVALALLLGWYFT